MPLSPDQIKQRWASGMQGAAGKYKDGVANPRANPGQAAAAQKSQYVAGVNAAADRWATNVAAVPQAYWTARCQSVGAGRLAEAGTKSADRYGMFISKFQPFVQNARQSIGPRGSYEQNMARQRQMSDILHNAKGQFKVTTYS